MNLCVFQGTFNPIHNAHLRVAGFVMDKYKFDKLLFIPAYNPPHKDCDNLMAQHRLNMVKLALTPHKNMEVSDIEYKRKGISYTYLTICELIKSYNLEGKKINFIIGTDAFEKIETWYETDKLKKLVHFIVFVRENDFNPKGLENLKNKGYDFVVEPLEFEDISSPELRKKVKNNEPICGMVAKEVEEYINKNGLYKS